MAIFNKETFFRRLRRVYSEWKEPSFDQRGKLKKIDFIILAVGAENWTYSKNRALLTWLLEEECTDTICVLAEKEVCFLINEQQIVELKQVENCSADGVPEIKLLLRDETDKNKRNFDTLKSIMKTSKNAKCGGIFSEFDFQGEFFDSWKAALRTERYKIKDLAMMFPYILCPHDETEFNDIQKVSLVTAIFFEKYSGVTHSDKEEFGENDEAALLSACLPSVLRQGDSDIPPKQKRPLCSEAVPFMLKFRLKPYLLKITHTTFVNPTKKMKKYNEFLLNVFYEVLRHLKPGAQLNGIYVEVYNYIKHRMPGVLRYLKRDFGRAMGNKFPEKYIHIGPGCKAVVKKGMIFHIDIGLVDIKKTNPSDENNKLYSLYIGRTVFVSDQGPAIVVSLANKPEIENICFNIKYDKGEDDFLEDSGHKFLNPNFASAEFSYKDMVINQKLEKEPIATDNESGNEENEESDQEFVEEAEMERDVNLDDDINLSYTSESDLCENDDELNTDEEILLLEADEEENAPTAG